MCGIGGSVGFNGLSVDDLSERLIAPLRYRGKDSEGVWSDDSKVVLVHTRLSIIDLASGQQPMADVSNRYKITFNGEIYNYKELREKYAARGARFATNSDTEVLLQGYALLGPAVVQDLNGMFALAIWDSKEEVLFVARDRLGKKPLYWLNVGSQFIFSSSLGSFLNVPGWNKQISKASICLFTILGSFPAPLTVYRGASALPAGCYAIIRAGQPVPAVTRYWSLSFEGKRQSTTEQALEEYSDVITRAITIRLRSDVPFGLAFSGGVDSGTIAAICKQRLNISVPCYTIDYHTEADKSAEVAQASKVARSLDLQWQHIQFDYNSEMLAQFPKAYADFDQPCLQFALVYSRLLYERIKPNSTVVLSGNGADEIFTGYSRDSGVHQSDLRNERTRRIPRFLHRFVRHKFPSFDTDWRDGDPIWKWAARDLHNYLDAFELDASDRDICSNWITMFANQVREAGCANMLDYVMYRDLFYSAADTNFRLADITGYSAQVEVRSPYLDFDVVQFAARLPHHLKVGQGPDGLTAKWLPKRFYSGMVGEELAWAPKRGMGANLRWDRQIAGDREFGQEVRRSLDALEGIGISPRDYLDAYEKYQQDYLNGQDHSNFAGIVMAGFMLGSWLRYH